VRRRVGGPLGAQQPVPRPGVDTAAVRRAEDPDRAGGAAALARHNAPGTRRVRGPYTVAAGERVSGDVAVVGGPATVAGHIAGRLTVVDGDLLLRPGAAVDGDVLVVGGLVDGQRSATFGGELRVVRRPVAYRVRRRQPAHARRRASAAARPRLAAPSAVARPAHGPGITLASGRTYNRVEGLPDLGGPSYETSVGRTGALAGRPARRRAHGGAAAVGRRAPRARGARELRGGPAAGAAHRARLYDEVAPVEAGSSAPTSPGWPPSWRTATSATTTTATARRRRWATTCRPTSGRRSRWPRSGGGRGARSTRSP
jgi:hypothetical protein